MLCALLSILVLEAVSLVMPPFKEGNLVPQISKLHEKGCTKLTNRGSFFSLDISVGSPPQHFIVVADTGSTSVLVPSCVCQENGNCLSANGRCFRGTNHSSTFNAELLSTGEPDTYELEFGSGYVKSFITTDIVRVAQVEHLMKNGLLLMMQERLDMGRVVFEGILGLGRPLPEQPGFMKDAGVSAFSVCFTEDAGFLRIDAPKKSKQLTTISDEHWAVGLHSVTIGNSSQAVSLQICSADDQKEGDVAACAAIPDSGTTVMMVPSEHMTLLSEGICDAWSLCLETHGMLSPENVKVIEERNENSKSLVLTYLLEECFTWLGDSGLDDMPWIHFHVVGQEGVEDTVHISPYSYILSSSNGCRLAFNVMDVDTNFQGPIWILGMPLFFDYHVNYGLEADPPLLSFDPITRDDPCSECGIAVPILVQTLAQQRHRALRNFSGPLRVIHINEKF